MVKLIVALLFAVGVLVLAYHFHFLQLATGVLLGLSLTILVYHFHVLAQLKTYAVDWRARAISAEQEVENWKIWARAKNLDTPFRK